MKSTLRHYGPVAIMLAVIGAVCLCLSLVMGGRAEDDRPRVLVTTYPLYVAARNVLGDTDGVELTLLSGAGAGCLHDYQLTPADRLAIERADAVIVNGAGAEPFLEGLVEESRLVDTSAGMTLLESDGHHHDHHDHHEACYNEHVWVSPARYYVQVLAILSAMEEIDPANGDSYLENAAAYADRMQAVGDRFPVSLDRPCVLFHDSLSYLAEYVGLDVKLTISAEGESGLSATDLATVEVLAKEYPDLVLLYDTQYPIRYTAIDDLVPANQVIALETAVVGDGKASDWLDAMERNSEKLQKLTGGDAP